MILKPGDFFCTKNPMALGRAINFIEKLWAKDNEAEYSHSGIITDAEGNTLEALWKLGPNSLNSYIGQRVIIGRWQGMTTEAYWKGINEIKEDIGKIYPLWRLPLFIIPGAAKWISTGSWMVCSEWDCKFLIAAGFSEIGRWQGQDPEDVADMIKKWKMIDVVYEGIWYKS